MADVMTREAWGRIEYLAIMLAGGFEYWAICTDTERADWRCTSARALAVLDSASGSRLADALETLGISKRDV
jgi:hypothetical protein